MAEWFKRVFEGAHGKLRAGSVVEAVAAQVVEARERLSIGCRAVAVLQALTLRNAQANHSFPSNLVRTRWNGVCG